MTEQEDSNQQDDEQDMDQHSDQQDDLPDLVESDGEDDEAIGSIHNSSIFSNKVDESIFITSDMVNTHLFCDDHIMTLKSNGNIILMSCVHRGPNYPTAEQLERWAAGDGGASDADNQQEAIITWEKHAKDSRVNVYRKNLFLRSVGWMNDSDDDDISKCTDLLDMYTAAEAQHNKYILHPVPIWASPDEVARYKQGIAPLYQLGQGVWMKVLAKNIWLGNMEELSTDHVRMHQDPTFWYEQHIMDLDINRLHNEMIGYAQKYMRGDVSRMETYIKYG